MATATGSAPLFGRRNRKLQQFAQSGSPGTMHGRTDCRFQRFQIHTARLMAGLEHHPQQLLYFARDLLPDRFGRFFPLAIRSPRSGEPDRST
jgi:hypothetical protein